MSKKLRIMIQGDLFMKPEAFEDAVRRHLEDLEYDLEFRAYQYPYPIEQSELPKESLPSGMGVGWDDISHSPNAEVGEYYGEADSFVGKMTDEDILLVHMAPITKAVIDNAKNLKYIGSCRGGARNVNVEAATARNIPVCNAPGRNAIPVAEFTVGLLLSHARYIARGHAYMKQGIWKVGAYRGENAGPQLRGKTVGIVGLGNIGREIAGMLSGFQVKLVAYDPFVSDDAYKAVGAEKASLNDLLSKADFVIMSTALTKDTNKMIGVKELALMKPTAYLINAARGGLIDYDALRTALKDNTIGGAAIDVYDPEPPMKDDPLLTMPNVTLTPHIAAASTGVLHKSADIVAAELRRYLTGEKLNSCLNPEALNK